MPTMTETHEHPVKPPAPRLRRGILRRFSRSADGATAVEMGFVALPFFTLLLATLETALVFFGQLMLDSGLNEAARLVRTGQAQEQNFSADAFRTEVCSRAYGLIDCDDSIWVDVRSFDNFQDINLPDPLNEDGEVEDNFAYDDGQEGDIIVARAFYEMFLFTPSPWGVGLANMASGNRLLTSTATFRNEPFGTILQ